MNDHGVDAGADDVDREEAIRTAETLVEISSLRDQIKIVSQVLSGLNAQIVEHNERAKELKAERQHERTFATYRSVNSARRTAVGLRSVADVVRCELDRLKASLASFEAGLARVDEPVDAVRTDAEVG